MRNNPFFYQTLFQSFPWPCYYNCYFHSFTVISYLIKGLTKSPQRNCRASCAAFCGWTDGLFSEKNIDILHTLCALSQLSRIYVDCDCGQTNSKVEYLDENFEKLGRKLQVLKCFESTRMIKRKDKQKSLHKT